MADHGWAKTEVGRTYHREYMRKRRLTRPGTSVRTPAWDRIMARTELVESGCWVFQGATSRDGYAQIHDLDGRNIPVHRVTYEHVKGVIPGGLVVDHLCRNHRCVNPDHLEAVTQRENVLRGETIPARNLQKTECVHGHPLFGANLYVLPGGKRKGRRICRSCVAIRRGLTRETSIA